MNSMLLINDRRLQTSFYSLTNLALDFLTTFNLKDLQNSILTKINFRDLKFIDQTNHFF